MKKSHQSPANSIENNGPESDPIGNIWPQNKHIVLEDKLGI